MTASPATIGSTRERTPTDDPVELLRTMLRIRYFEDEVKALFGSGAVRGSTHLCQGQEAAVVGVCSLLRTGDTMTCTYRGHGAVLAMGSDLVAAFGEILGRTGGLCGGKGGSMHFADFALGALGSNAIVGAQLPIAVGAALANQYLATGAVTVAFTGDGSTNIGAFHEAVNLAAIWRLPVIFLVENNQYGEYSPVASTTPIDRLADRAASYGIPGCTVDGNDVFEVRRAAADAVERARRGEGPSLIEADTYRLEGHSRSDAGSYRPPGELEAWQAKDPIDRLEQALRQQGAFDEEALAALRDDVRSQVRSALRQARALPEPDVSAMMENVYQ